MTYNTVLQGDCLEVLKTLPDKSIDCCVTSPPYYGLRDYGVNGQIGLEETPEKYIEKLVDVFREVRRVLKDDGTLWLNIGDSYAGTGSKGDYKDPKYAEGRNGQAVSLTQLLLDVKIKTLSASRGCLPLRSATMIGICAKTSFGRSLIRCLKV